MPPQLQPPSPAPRASSRGSGKRTGNNLLPERSASFHGRTKTAVVTPPDLRRHKTQPNLLSGSTGRRRGDNSKTSAPDLNRRKVPAKALVNVNVQRSLGALQVVASAEWTVDQLVEAAVKRYVKEGRRPLLMSVDPLTFSLHYSQFSLEGLDPKEKLIGLGSRNFFLCPKSTATTAFRSGTTTNEEATSSSSCPLRPSSLSTSCSNEQVKASKIAIPWLKFMDLLF